MGGLPTKFDTKESAMTTPQYTCLTPECRHTLLSATENGLKCPNGCPSGSFIPFADGTNIPIFYSQEEDSNEYTTQLAAEIHDNALAWLFATFRVSEESLRSALIRRLDLRSGSRVLVTGAGAGNDIPFILKSLSSEGEIYVQDIAKEMLLFGAKRIALEEVPDGIGLFFSVSDASDLPFRDNFFDAALHFGGINLYNDKRRGLSEMARVVRPGGRVVVGDEGVAPWLRDSELGRMLICNTSLYACSPPLDQLPLEASNVEVTWEMSNCFYVISFTVAHQSPSIDIDIPHIGIRGGSIRKRYFGQLEGIDPTLKSHLYERAREAGISRVDFLEQLIRDGLSND